MDYLKYFKIDIEPHFISFIWVWHLVFHYKEVTYSIGIWHPIVLPTLKQKKTVHHHTQLYYKVC